MIDPKDPAEKYPVEFDFSAVMSSVTAATVTVSVVGGYDASPSGILDGLPQITGSKAYQRVQAGVAGCIYKLRCEATDGTTVYAVTSALPVRVK